MDLRTRLILVLGELTLQAVDVAAKLDEQMDRVKALTAEVEALKAKRSRRKLAKESTLSQRKPTAQDQA